MDPSSKVYGPILLTHWVLDVHDDMLIKPFHTTFTLYRTICFAVTLNTSYMWGFAINIWLFNCYMLLLFLYRNCYILWIASTFGTWQCVLLSTLCHLVLIRSVRQPLLLKRKLIDKLYKINIETCWRFIEIVGNTILIGECYVYNILTTNYKW